MLEPEVYHAAPPIFRAVYDGDLQALRRAIAEGADLNARTRYRNFDGEEVERSYTPLHWLICNDPFANLDNTYDLRTSQDRPLDPRRLACISALVEAGADVNTRSGSEDPDDEDNEPCTPIHAALYSFDPAGSRQVVTLLLRAGADVTIATPDGCSPLHTAAIHSDNCDNVAALLAAGADVNAIFTRERQAFGFSFDTVTVQETPLESALGFFSPGSGRKRIRILAMLLRAGARLPNWPDPPHCHRIPPYIDAVAKAGGYVRYERAHRARLAAIFIPKFTWLPAEVVPTIVAFWADCGGHLPRALNPSLPPTVHGTGHTSES